jgi:hypothetical protein
MSQQQPIAHPEKVHQQGALHQRHLTPIALGGVIAHICAELLEQLGSRATLDRGHADPAVEAHRSHEPRVFLALVGLYDGARDRNPGHLVAVSGAPACPMVQPEVVGWKANPPFSLCSWGPRRE